MTDPVLSPEALAEAFHHAYESLAPEFGYETRASSRVPWEQVPERNKALMIATVRAVFIERYSLLASAEREQQYRAVVEAARELQGHYTIKRPKRWQGDDGTLERLWDAIDKVRAALDNTPTPEEGK